MACSSAERWFCNLVEFFCSQCATFARNPGTSAIATPGAVSVPVSASASTATAAGQAPTTSYQVWAASLALALRDLRDLSATRTGNAPVGTASTASGASAVHPVTTVIPGADPAIAIKAARLNVRTDCATAIATASVLAR